MDAIKFVQTPQIEFGMQRNPRRQETLHLRVHFILYYPNHLLCQRATPLAPVGCAIKTSSLNGVAPKSVSISCERATADKHLRRRSIDLFVSLVFEYYSDIV